MLIGLCAAIHFVAYAAYKSYAADVVLQPLASPLRTQANAALRGVVAIYAGWLGVRVYVGRRAGWCGAAPFAPRGLVAGFVAYALVAGIAYRGAAPEVAWSVGLGVAGVGLATLVFVGTSPLHATLARHRKQLLLAAVSLVVSLELGLRGVYVASAPGRLADLADAPRRPAPGAVVGLRALLAPSPDAAVVYVLKPGLDVRFEGARVTTNAIGWREDEFERDESDGVVRILGIGDSVMFGWGVEAPARYMDRLEAALGRAYPDVRWQTLVSAVPGYNLAMEVAALRRDGLAAHPDLIVYGFVGNDAALPNFLQEPVSAWSLRSFIALHADLAWTRSASLLVDEWGDDGEQAIWAIDDPERAPAAYRWMLGPEGFRRAFAELEEVAGDVPIVVLGFEGDRGLLDPAHLGAARYVDVSVARAAAGEGFALGPHDPHPSPAGHAVLADALFRHLEEHGIAASLAARARADRSRAERHAEPASPP